MPINEQRARYHLKSGDLQDLFIHDLGWNHYNTLCSIILGNQTYTLSPLAERNGVAALRCEPNEDGAIPEYSSRRKIEQAVTKLVAEHIIVFVDGSGNRQIWQWVRREPGKPSAYREHSFESGTQSGDALVHKLRHVAYDLAEEEASTLTGAAAKLRKAFDVEKVTKKFFDLFKKQHADFLKQIEGIGSDEDKAWYASVMLNRLMFVRFIQQKRFLADDADYLRNRLKMVQQSAGAGRFHDFYRLFLLRLFHEGLGEKPGDRTDDKNIELQSLLGNVPYLNGGIFSKHSLEETYAEAIRIPDSAFDAIFTFFDGFDWLLDNRPLKSEKEINPDVLGYIFEKYINQKEMGAYYTKEDITEYIGRNTIVPYLFDAAKEKCPHAFEPGGIWRIAHSDPDRYIFPAMKYGMETPLPADIAAGIENVALRGGWNRPADAPFALPTEIWREVVARRTRCQEVRKQLSAGNLTDVKDLTDLKDLNPVCDINDFITLNLNSRQFAQDVIENCEDPDLLQAIWKSVETVRVLDPTVGSGAFLFAALNILEPLYEACLDRMEAFVGDTERAQATWAGEMAFVNEVSAQQAFIEESATEYAEQFKKILAIIADHRDRRYHIYKSIIVNNLFGVDIMEEATEICKLRLFLKLVAQIDRVEDLEPLPDIDFNIRAGNTLVGYANIEDIDRLWQAAEFADTSKSGSMSFERDNDRLRTMANEYAHLLKDFRKQQLGEVASTTATKDQVARAANDVLRPELDKDLWRLYRKRGKLAEKTSMAQFLSSHSPLHWFVEFPEVMAAGGFDVVIGNPPFVEYQKVHDQYQVLDFDTLSCANLYALTFERASHLSKTSNIGRVGLITPIAAASVIETAPLRKHALTSYGTIACSNYAIRPAKLFEGVEQRLTIWIMQRGHNSNEIWSTKYYQWYAEERATLIDRTTYVECARLANDVTFPKISSLDEARMLEAIRSRNETVGDWIDDRGTEILFFHRTPGYWVRALDFLPYFRSKSADRSIHHIREVPFANTEQRNFVGALMSSSLFFWWMFACGNCRNLTLKEVRAFPIGKPTADVLARVSLLYLSLMADYRQNAHIRKRGGTEYEELNWPHAKPLVDAIDVALCEHYGLSGRFVDFIVNYDIKIRSTCASDDE